MGSSDMEENVFCHQKLGIFEFNISKEEQWRMLKRLQV